jgi:hypothetical protein
MPKVLVDEKAITLLKVFIYEWQEEDKSWDKIREEYGDDIPYHKYKDRVPDEVAYEVLDKISPTAKAFGIEIDKEND